VMAIMRPRANLMNGTAVKHSAQKSLENHIRDETFDV
jgi:hypothetical protein